MLTNLNKTKRFEGTDLVSTQNFNTVLDSFDRILCTKEGYALNSSTQSISFGSNTTNNISINISLKILESSNIGIKIKYEDPYENQEFLVLEDYGVVPETYIFSPVYISIKEGTLVEVEFSSNKNSLYGLCSISATAM